MRGVGGVCEMRLARRGVGGEGGEWMRGLALGFTNPVGHGMSWTCVCVVVAVVWVGSGLGTGSGGVGWFYVCVSCESGLSV